MANELVMCSNIKCPLRASCYRYVAEPNDYGQRFAEWEPAQRGATVECAGARKIPRDGTGRSVSVRTVMWADLENHRVANAKHIYAN